MPTTSIITATRARLVALLTAALPTVQVDYAYREPFPAEVVYVGDVRASNNVADIRAGRKARDVEFTMDVFLVVTKDGDDQQTTDERCEVLYAALEDVLADDPKLGQTNVLWARLGDEERTPGMTADGRVATIRAEVVCRARLT